jgi:hypothetical protein
MDVIYQIFAGLSIFLGALIFGNGFDKRPRLNGHNEVYKRRMKRFMATGIAMAVLGLSYFIIF